MTVLSTRLYVLTPRWAREAPAGAQALPHVALTQRAVVAIATGLAVAGLLELVFAGRALATLPEYLAVILAFVAVLVVPGLVVLGALLPGRSVDVATRLAIAPAIGTALAAVPGCIAVYFHTDLHTFEAMFAALAGTACGVAVLARRTSDEVSPEPPDRLRGANVLLAAMLLVALGGVATTPFWARDRIAADFDDWTYMAYVRSYVDGAAMNAQEPFLGTGEAVNPRMRSNGWVAVEAALSDATGVPPYRLLLEYLRPLLAIGAVAAAYAFARTLARSQTVGLLAAALFLGYGLLDMTAHEGVGRNVFIRIGEDKMVGIYLLLPVALIFAHRYIERPAAQAYAGFALVALALAAVHPVPLLFLLVTLATLIALRASVERRLAPLAAPALLVLAVLAGSVWPLIQREALADAVPEVFSTQDSALTFRNSFHFVELGGGLIMGNYHLILHPLMLVAVVLAPLLWLARRRELGHQLLLAMTAGAVACFFVPPLSTALSKVATPQTLWRLPWLVPVAPLLAVAAYEAASAFDRRRPLVATVAPAAIVVLVLAGALVVQDQYARFDGGSFYDRTSASSLVPGAGHSIFLGGVDRTFSGLWRLSPYQRELPAYMDASIPPGSVVLAEPPVLNHMLPGVLTDVYPVDFGGVAGEGQRREDAAAFARGDLTDSELSDVLDRWGVGYVVVRETAPANEELSTHPRLTFLEEVVPFVIYAVDR